MEVSFSSEEDSRVGGISIGRCTIQESTCIVVHEENRGTSGSSGIKTTRIVDTKQDIYYVNYELTMSSGGGIVGYQVLSGLNTEW